MLTLEEFIELAHSTGYEVAFFRRGDGCSMSLERDAGAFSFKARDVAPTIPELLEKFPMPPDMLEHMEAAIRERGSLSGLLPEPSR